LVNAIAVDFPSYQRRDGLSTPSAKAGDDHPFAVRLRLQQPIASDALKEGVFQVLAPSQSRIRNIQTLYFGIDGASIPENRGPLVSMPALAFPRDHGGAALRTLLGLFLVQGTSCPHKDTDLRKTG